MAEPLSSDPLGRDEDDLVYNPHPMKSRVEESSHVWLFSAMMMMSTFRHLCEGGYPFPMRLLVIHLTIALVITQQRSQRRDPLKKPRRLDIITLLCSAVYIGATAGALIFTYQAALHLPNTVVVAMFLSSSLPYLEDDKAAGIPSASEFLSGLIPRYGLLVGCVVCMFLYEDQLSINGIRASILAASCVAIMRFSSLLGASEYLPGPRSNMISIQTYGLILTLPIALYQLFKLNEAYPTRAVLPSNQWTMFAVNILAGGVMLLSGTPFKNLTRKNEGVTLRSHQASWESLALVMVSAIDNAFLRLIPCEVSPWQWLAYTLAFSASIVRVEKSSTTDRPRDPSNVELKNGMIEDADTQEFGADGSSNNRSRYQWALLTYSVSIIPILMIVYHGYLAKHILPSLQPSPSGPNATLDVVFARYGEDVSETTIFTEQFLALPILKEVDVRVVVYNKGNQTDDFAPLEAVTNSLVVRNVSNVGREGETYISHILNEWDGLAHHTLFLQAGPHEPTQLLERVRDYYGPDTGFLSLSYTRNFCQSCSRCTDQSVWQGEPEIFREVHDRTNKEPCQGMSLTYRGQFIVSKERARNLDRDFLEETRQKLIDDDTYGYTLERLWGVIFQCPKISSACPTLDSGSLGNMGSGGRADCQCLDGR